MEQNTHNKTWIWVIIALAVIVVFGVIGYSIYSGPSVAIPTTEPVVETPKPVNLTRNSLIIDDQYPGITVFVSEAELAEGGFVVIHKNENGKPGAIIGSQYFDKGRNPGQIKLSESTIEGYSYFGMLHSDSGDKKFNPSEDLPLKDSLGNVIMTTFKASSKLQEVKG